MSIKPAKKANQIQQHESIRIDLVRQFLENQSRELANHTEEIELKKRNEKTGMIMLVEPLLHKKKTERKNKHNFNLLGYTIPQTESVVYSDIKFL